MQDCGLGLLHVKEATGIVSAIDGNRLKLKDGRIVRLADIIHPESEFHLEDHLQFVIGKWITIFPTMKNKDRFGDLRAHIVVQDSNPLGESIWLQEHLVINGAAHIYVYPGIADCGFGLRFVEQKARKQKLGIWASNAPGIVFSADDPNLSRQEGRYRIVTGRVRTTGSTRRWKYLNFGTDWAQDFTTRLTPRAEKELEKQGVSLSALQHKRVEIRGVIQSNRGPMIDVFTASQIMVLD